MGSTLAGGTIEVYSWSGSTVACISVSDSHSCGAGPRIFFTDLITNHPNTSLPATPTPTPMNMGNCLPRTSNPCWVPYLVMKRGPSTLFAALMVDMGMELTIALPQ